MYIYTCISKPNALGELVERRVIATSERSGQGASGGGGGGAAGVGLPTLMTAGQATKARVEFLIGRYLQLVGRPTQLSVLPTNFVLHPLHHRFDGFLASEHSPSGSQGYRISRSGILAHQLFLKSLTDEREYVFVSTDFLEAPLVNARGLWALTRYSPKEVLNGVIVLWSTQDVRRPLVDT